MEKDDLLWETLKVATKRQRRKKRGDIILEKGKSSLTLIQLPDQRKTLLL